MTEPIGGFNYTAIYKMFHPPAPNKTVVTQNNSTSNDNNNIDTSQIASAMIGSVVGAYIVIGLAVWFLRQMCRKRRR